MTNPMNEKYYNLHLTDRYLPCRLHVVNHPNEL